MGLAQALGKTLGELGRMSSLEYTHWQALAEIEPIGPERADYHAAQIARSLFELKRNSKIRSTPFAVAEFLMFQPPEPDELDDDEVQRRLFAAFPPPP